MAVTPRDNEAQNRSAASGRRSEFRTAVAVAIAEPFWTLLQHGRSVWTSRSCLPLRWIVLTFLLRVSRRWTVVGQKSLSTQFAMIPPRAGVGRHTASAVDMSHSVRQFGNLASDLAVRPFDSVAVVFRPCYTIIVGWTNVSEIGHRRLLALSSGRRTSDTSGNVDCCCRRIQTRCTGGGNSLGEQLQSNWRTCQQVM